MKSALYAANTVATAVEDGGTINFGNTIRRFGCNTRMEGPNPVVKGAGYYRLTANVTITPSANGIGTLTLYKNGVVIPGATSQLVVAAGSPYSFVVIAIVREVCDCESAITARISGIGGTVNNAAIAIEKL